MKHIEEFFLEMDRRWKEEAEKKIPLKIIGSGALLLQVAYERPTKDSDVLETPEITTPIKEHLLKLAGNGSDLGKSYRLYLDIVASGIPFLPHSARYRGLPELNRKMKHFAIEALDITDVVVRKLKRFNANDVSDVAAMVSGGWVKHAALVEQFRKAVDAYSTDARAEDLPKYVKNLHTIERDFYKSAPSEIELPDWV